MPDIPDYPDHGDSDLPVAEFPSISDSYVASMRAQLDEDDNLTARQNLGRRRRTSNRLVAGEFNYRGVEASIPEPEPDTMARELVPDLSLWPDTSAYKKVGINHRYSLKDPKSWPERYEHLKSVGSQISRARGKEFVLYLREFKRHMPFDVARCETCGGTGYVKDQLDVGSRDDDDDCMVCGTSGVVEV